MNDKQIDSAIDTERRRFLRTASVAGGAAALAGATGQAVAAGDPPPAEDARASRGYHETEHVRAYYESARI